MGSDLKERTVKSLIWKLTEKMGSQIVQLVITIVLAHLLTPNDYGTVALVTVFIGIAMVFVEYGLSTALIQNKRLESEDIDTTFIMSLILGAALYIILFLCAPLLATFYEVDELTLIVRILSMILILGAINSIQNALLQRQLKYRSIFIANFLSTIVSGVLGIIMAYMGYGVWALVAQQIMLRIVSGIVYGLQTKYIPKLRFSFEYAKNTFSFGINILLAQFLRTLFTQIRSLIIGKIYSTEAVAYYNKGEQFPAIVATSTDYSFQQVMFSIYSKKQDDNETLKRMMRKSLVTSFFLLFPAMLGLCSIAEPLIHLLLGEKWMQAVPFMQIICLAYAFNPIITMGTQVINSKGQSGVTLRVELKVRIFAIILIVISTFINIYAIAFSQVVVYAFNSALMIRENKNNLKYTYREQIRDLYKTIIATTVMIASIFLINDIIVPLITLDIVIIIIDLVVGVLIYMLTSFLIKSQGLDYMVNIVKMMLLRFKSHGVKTH